MKRIIQSVYFMDTRRSVQVFPRLFVGVLTVGFMMLFLWSGVAYSVGVQLSDGDEQVGKRVIPQDVVITLTDDGYLPKTIRIPVGTTVKFKTTTGRYFWPASNQHPEHNEYSEFDPKQPLKQDDTWSFRFDRLGTWGFHDHISPFFTGTIQVVGGQQNIEGVRKEKITMYQIYKDVLSYLNRFITQKLIYVNYSNCQRISFSREERIECWEKIVVPVIQRKGLKIALAFVDRRIKTDVNFAADCHIYMHRIGEEYYWQFFKRRHVEVSDKFGLCEMGFFHGFMQEFTSHSQNIFQAKRYCDLVTAQMKDIGRKPELLLQCYHGIGHGLVYMYAPQFWGHENEIIQKSIEDCKKITDKIDECVTGVFGGIAAMHWGLHGFHLPMKSDDPFRICRRQPQEYALGCYNMYIPVVYGVLDSDLVRAGHVVEQIKDSEIARVAMEHLGSMPSYALIPQTDDYTAIIKQCRAFRTPFDEWCLRGFSGSLLRIGGENMAIDRGANFCLSSEMTKQEQKFCFEAILGQDILKSSNEKTERFCRGVMKKYNINPCTGE